LPATVLVELFAVNVEQGQVYQAGDVDALFID